MYAKTSYIQLILALSHLRLSSIFLGSLPPLLMDDLPIFTGLYGLRQPAGILKNQNWWPIHCSNSLDDDARSQK